MNITSAISIAASDDVINITAGNYIEPMLTIPFALTLM